MQPVDLGEFTEVRVAVPWGYLAGRWYGDQLQRPILALHGWLDNCGTFAKLAPLLSPYASILCIDLPGHGYSSHLPVGVLYSNMEYVRTIRRLMLTYNWEKVSLMGHSMGGSVCFHFAALFPDKVDILIGLDIVKTRYFGPEIFPVVWQHIVEKALIDNERLEWQSTLVEPPSYTFDECEQLLYEGSERSVNIENCKYILERNISKSSKYPEKYYFSRDGRVKYLAEFNPNPALSNLMGKRIATVPIPYVVIKGGASTNISARSKAVIDVLRERNPLFAMYEIEGGTHHVHLNDANKVAAYIIPFLQKYRPLGKEVGASQNQKAKTSKL